MDDRHADLADLAAGELVIGVVAGLGRQVEGDGEPRLSLREVAAIELVRGLRRRVPGVGAHHPGPVGPLQPWGPGELIAAHAPNCTARALFWGVMTGQTTELPRIGSPGSGLGDSWRVIVRNDDHNTFDHVARTLARYIPATTLARGHELAQVIHSSGQAIVFSGQQETAEHYWEQLKGAGLTMAPLEQG